MESSTNEKKEQVKAIGKFQVLTEELGKGSYGVVKKARNVDHPDK